MRLPPFKRRFRFSLATLLACVLASGALLTLNFWPAEKASLRIGYAQLSGVGYGWPFRCAIHGIETGNYFDNGSQTVCTFYGPTPPPAALSFHWWRLAGNLFVSGVVLAVVAGLGERAAHRSSRLATGARGRIMAPP